jgi:hypothetical protein
MTATLPSALAVPIPAPRVGAAGCIDGLVTVPTEDGPVHYACQQPCCKQRRDAARAERTTALGGRDPFARLPQVEDESW